MRLEKLLANRIWGDEIFYATETVENILVTAPAGVEFTEDSTIVGEATVAVLGCELSEVGDDVVATVEFMIQEELTVQIDAAPGPDDFPLEYAFRFERDFTFQKLLLPDDVDIVDLNCQIFRFEGTVTIENVNLPIGGSTGTFDNVASTLTKIIVGEEIQTFVCLGTAPNVRTTTVTVTIEPVN